MHNSNMDDVQTFDRRSSTYEHSFFQRLFFDRIHRAALNLIPTEFNPEAILDIGCGTGRLLRKAAVRWPGARLSGVDPAEGMIREARRLTPGATFYVSTAESLALPDCVLRPGHEHDVFSPLAGSGAGRAPGGASAAPGRLFLTG